jgi:hypothetical protein
VLAAPGTYTATLAKQVDGTTTELAGPVSFQVERMRKGALAGAEPEATVSFWRRIAEVQRATSAARQALDQAFDRLKDLRTALSRSLAAPDGLDAELHAATQELYEIEEALRGSRTRSEIGDPNPHTIERRLQVAMTGTMMSTYGPTPTHRRSLEIAEQEFEGLRQRLSALLEQRLPALERQLEEAGAPWTPGRALPEVRR